jgi:acetyl-CoA synthetase
MDIKTVVVRRAGNDVKMGKNDLWWHEAMSGAKDYCKPVQMDSEDILFILYTSGTTGKPKGITHTIGGYLTQAYWTARWDFDLHLDDVFWCTADVGWITGHTYGCYGPLSNGATILIYEGAPDFPGPDRWWEIIEKHKVTIFYTAPTAIRMFMRYGDEWPARHDLTSLRLLGTVGEPINREAWLWYFKHVGGSRCPIIDTWWQTETGGTLINALPGIGPFIPTVAGPSFPGIRHDILDESGKPIGPGQSGFLVQLSPFAPGMLRGVFKDPARYKETYWSEYGDKIYYTSDGARRENGYFRITGRVDDVLKVAGHRLSTAEVENALSTHKKVAECAVVGAKHEIKGEVPIAFVILKRGVKESDELARELIKQVDKNIGPTARPGRIYFVPDVPKTRSGKIMRRILKRLVLGEKPGDVSTLRNPECVTELQKMIQV